MLKKFNYIKIIVVVLLFMLSIASVTSIFASEKREQGSYSVVNFEILEDVNGSYQFSDVSSLEFNERYINYSEEILSLGITKSVYWIRFKFPATLGGEPPENWFLQFNNPNIEKIDLYMPSANSGYLLKEIGVSRPASKKDITHNTWVCQLPHNFVPEKNIYLRLEGTSALRLPVVFWQQGAFLADAFLENTGFGVIYGVFIAMLLFNMFVFFALRDKVYLFYVLYMGSMLLYQFQVHGHLRMFIDIPYKLYNDIFWMSLGSSVIFSVYFTRAFLNVQEGAPKLDKILTGILFLAVLQSILGVCGFDIWANHIAHLIGLFGPCFMMILAGIRYRQGFRSARYYLLAWGVLLIGVVIWSLSAYVTNAFPAVNYLLLGTAGESILLSFALADRVRTLRLKKEELSERVEHYRDLSLTDDLTGLYNKRYLYKKLSEETRNAQQEGKPLSFLVIDIDNFKLYNDTYGHWEGDRVLIKLGEIFLSVLQQPNTVFRYGGEEFTVVLPNMRYNDALCVAEKIREKLQTESFNPTSDITVYVTVSIGVTELDAGDSIESLFQRADDALYKAKNEGRNRTVVIV